MCTKICVYLPFRQLVTAICMHLLFAQFKRLYLRFASSTMCVRRGTKWNYHFVLWRSRTCFISLSLTALAAEMPWLGLRGIFFFTSPACTGVDLPCACANHIIYMYKYTILCEVVLRRWYGKWTAIVHTNRFYRSNRRADDFVPNNKDRRRAHCSADLLPCCRRAADELPMSISTHKYSTLIHSPHNIVCGAAIRIHLHKS